MRAVARARVLFLNDTARNGGPGRTLHTLLKGFDPALIHRAVVVPRPGVVSQLLESVCEELFFEPLIVENPFAPWTREMVREDFDASFALKAIRAIGNVGLGTRGVLRLIDRVNEGRYDVVFCNGTTANFFGGIITRLTGVPVVWHVFYPSVVPVLRPIHEMLAAQDGVRSIVCVSKAVMQQFGSMDKVVCMHDAIDTDEFSPGATRGILRDELGIPKDVPILGSQGRIIRRKGFIELVRAAKKIDVPCRVVILGDTPQDMPVDHLEECRALVRELGLEDRVHFLGYRPDVRPYVEDFDVAVVPSVYPDPLPRSVLESMSLAKPVVAFDMGGIGEMVEDGVTGLLVRGDPPDIDGLARALKSLIRDPERRRTMGRIARDHVIWKHGARAHAREIEDVLLGAVRA